MPKEREYYLEQLYCLIVSQLLQDGYTSIASSLLKVSNLGRYGGILPSSELFNVVFGDEYGPEEENGREGKEDGTSIQKDPAPQELRVETMEKTRAKPKNERSSGDEKSSKSFLKNVKMKTKFVYNHVKDTRTSQSEADVFYINYLPRESALRDTSDTEQTTETPVTEEEKIAISPIGQLVPESFICDGEVKFEDVGALVVSETDMPSRTTRHSKKIKLCYHCNTQESNLGKHILECHATRMGKGLKCNICERVIQKKLYNFNEHLKTHNDVKHFLCPDCGMGFKRAAAHRNHMETMHANRNFACDICGKKLRCSTALRAHKYTHTKEYNLPCSTCGKCFRYSRDLLNHELTHTGAKPQKCSLCEKNFRTQSQKLRHIKQQHGTSIIYKCGLCQYSVIQKCNLKIHMKRHTGVKYGDIFICSVCLAGFPNSDSLEEHKGNCNETT